MQGLATKGEGLEALVPQYCEVGGGRSKVVGFDVATKFDVGTKLNIGS